ncbi:MAG: fatty acid desaturase [Alphaproteobacteria bacterium]|nr:MAG: fatty acid desaturase [Alphaproteobacteria bacterium]
MSTQWRDIKPSDILTSHQAHVLRQRSDLMGAWLLLHCWALIAGAMAAFALWPGVPTFLLCLVVVGGRQLGLAILMHEGSHGMLFKSRKLNERLSQWLAAWPMLLNMHGYRKRHMAHHRFTRTDQDPENYLYTPFPVTPASMTRKIVRDLVGIVFLRTQLGIFRFVAGPREGRFGRLKAFYGGPLLVYALATSAFTAAGGLHVFLFGWLIPLMTTQQLFLRIRNIAEHAAVPELDNPLRNTRTTRANLLERLTFAPYFVNYHIEHHLMPFVPCWRLPEVHHILLEKGYGPDMEIRDGYIDIIKLNAAA